MKKSFLLSLLLLLILSISANAQVLPKFGIMGGLNVANFTSDLDIYESKPGVMIGAFVDLNIPLSPVSIQPELVYAQFGAGISDTDATINMNYIQVPVLLKFKIPAPVVTPNLFVGPYANILTSAEVDGDGGSVDIDEYTKGSTFGVVLGGGIEATKIQVGLRLSAGLSEVFDEDFSDGEKNLGVALTLGVKL